MPLRVDRFKFLVTALALTGLLCVRSALAADPRETYEEATEALYSLDFVKAEAAFGQLTETHPAEPDYWNGLAASVWLKILYDQQKLNMESFSSQDRFGTSESEDKISEEDEARLRQLVKRAIEASDSILKKDQGNIHALYAKGAANATLASFEGTVKRAYMAAARKAKAAHDLHEEVLKKDPTFHDARASVGIYDYVVASIPGILRYTILLPLGLHGDGKKVGIERLEEAAAKGKRASVDAKMLLVVVYNREGQYAKSLKLIDELHAKYPRNFMFEISKASIYQKQKNWAAAIETYKRIAENVRDRKNGYERLRLEKVYYELGNCQIHGMQFDDAAATFAKVVAGEKAGPNEKAISHLWMGKVLDGKYQVTRDPRQRADAVEHYRAVEKLNCDAALKKEARAFLRRPFVSK